MQSKTLYRYTREDGGITVSTEKPDCEYTTLTRLIADEGKALTKDGEHLMNAIDVDSTEGFYEVDVEEDKLSNIPLRYRELMANRNRTV